MSAKIAEGWQTTGYVWWCDAVGVADDAIRCPYEIPGDRLWVRETWREADCYDPAKYLYRASDWAEQCRVHRLDSSTISDQSTVRWYPSINMPVRGCGWWSLSERENNYCHADHA